MKKLAKTLALAAAALALGLGMASCDYWDSDWYKEGGGSGDMTSSGSGERVFDLRISGDSGDSSVDAANYFTDDVDGALSRDTVRAIKPSTTPPPSGAQKVCLGRNKDIESDDSDFKKNYTIGWREGDTLYYFAYGYSDSGRKIPIQYFASPTIYRTLTEIDVSGFDTSHVLSMREMFARCSKLTTIYASPSFVVPADNYEFHFRFDGCTSLVGGAGTTYAALQAAQYNNGWTSVSPSSRDLARIDGGPSAPGYFTAKP